MSDPGSNKKCGARGNANSRNEITDKQLQEVLCYTEGHFFSSQPGYAVCLCKR
jgi:hypothetical protein